MKLTKRFLATVLSLALLVTMLAGCASSPAAESSAPPADASANPSGSGDEAFDSFGITPLASAQKLTVGYFSGALYSAIIYGADQKGWFEAAGLELDYQSFESGPAMMEANANWDVGISGAPGVLNGLVGYDVKCVAVVDYEQEQCLYVRPDSPIAKAGANHIEGYPEIYGTADDWRGTTWIMPVGTTIYMVFLDTLSKIGLTLDDVTVINMDVSSAKSAFLGGQGDGIGCWNTVSLSVAEEGNVKVAAASDGSVLASGMVMTNDAIANKFDAMTKFMEVFVKAQDYFAGHIDEYAAYMYETCQEEGVSSTEETAAIFVKAYAFLSSDTILKNATTYIDDVKGLADGQVTQTQADLLVMLDFFIDQGSYKATDRDFILEGGFDTTIAQAAANNLGIK